MGHTGFRLLAVLVPAILTLPVCQQPACMLLFFLQISDEVSRVNYVGDMESVEFDEHPMGLWNFVAGENNYVGARER